MNDWVTTIDTKAACPISTDEAAELHRLRRRLAELEAWAQRIMAGAMAYPLAQTTRGMGVVGTMPAPAAGPIGIAPETNADEPALPEFDSFDAAWDWAHEQEDDGCHNNDRFAFVDDAEAMAKFREAEANGCCGSFEADIIVGGRRAVIGYNYGH